MAKAKQTLDGAALVASVFGPEVEDVAALQRLADLRARLEAEQAALLRAGRPKASPVRGAAIAKGSLIEPPTPELEARARLEVVPTVVDGVTALAAKVVDGSTVARLSAKGRLDRAQVGAARRYYGLWRAAAFEPGVSTAFREPTGAGRGEASARVLEARDALHRARRAVEVVHRGALVVVDQVVIGGETAAAAGLAEGVSPRAKSAEARALVLLEVGLNALVAHFAEAA